MKTKVGLCGLTIRKLLSWLLLTKKKGTPFGTLALWEKRLISSRTPFPYSSYRYKSERGESNSRLRLGKTLPLFPNVSWMYPVCKEETCTVSVSIPDVSRLCGKSVAHFVAHLMIPPSCD
jgi:hypothetical protein